MVRYLCFDDERCSPSFVLYDGGSPNKPLFIKLVLNNFHELPATGRDSARVSGTRSTVVLFAMVYCPFHTSPKLSTSHSPANFAQEGWKRPALVLVYENVLFIISQLSIVYIVAKDNKFVTKHHARC